jgi:hypothetical protein
MSSKSRHWSDPSMKSIQKDTIPHKPSSRSVSAEHNAKSVAISSGEKIQQSPSAVILSNFLFMSAAKDNIPLSAKDAVLAFKVKNLPTRALGTDLKDHWDLLEFPVKPSLGTQSSPDGEMTSNTWQLVFIASSHIALPVNWILHKTQPSSQSSA